VRILIVDDSEVMRKGMRALLGARSDVRIVGEAADGEEGLTAIRMLAPDFVIMDVEMPRMGGVAALRALGADGLGVPKVLMASLFCEPELVVEALRAGASGYVFKHRLGVDLPQAITAVAGGGIFISRGASSAAGVDAPERAHAPAVAGELVRRLSAPHGRLLEVLAEGNDDACAAKTLGIAESEFGQILGHLLAALSLRTREELRAFARIEARVRAG
jgi:DNA-binding NarL/FixJ family response regulator